MHSSKSIIKIKSVDIHIYSIKLRLISLTDRCQNTMHKILQAFCIIITPSDIADLINGPNAYFRTDFLTSGYQNNWQNIVPEYIQSIHLSQSIGGQSGTRVLCSILDRLSTGYSAPRLVLILIPPQQCRRGWCLRTEPAGGLGVRGMNFEFLVQRYYDTRAWLCTI